MTTALEVQINRGPWTPYAAESLGVIEDTIYENFAGCHDDLVEFDSAQDHAGERMERALDVLVDNPDLPGVTGLRVLLWDCERALATGTPDYTETATARDFTKARLRQAADGVAQAGRALSEARSRLRAQAVVATFAARDADLGRNEIARTAGDAMARRLLVQYLAGHDRARAVRDTLPASWPRLEGTPGCGQPEWKKPLGPLWAGMVRLEVTTAGMVTLAVDANAPTAIGQPDEASASAVQALAAMAELDLVGLTPAGTAATADDLVVKVTPPEDGELYPFIMPGMEVTVVHAAAISRPAFAR